MLKNKKFGAYTIAFCILGIVYMFMYSGLQNDHINIIQTYITADGGGWSATLTQLPKTVGDFVCIALTFAYGTLFIKYGVRKTLIPCIVLSALGCVGIVAANGLDIYGGATTGIYWLYAISLFVIRCTCMCLQMSGFQLAASWYIKYRGRIMGIITLGSPLFSVVGTSVMTNFINNRLGGDYRPFYIGIAVILAVIALLTRILLKDTPEEAGLYPDGADHPPISEQEEPEIKLTVKQVLSEKRGWIMIVSYAAFQFIINGCMSSMAVRFMALGGIEVWLSATTYLAMGAILGIPMSYVFGWIDDKLGTVTASFILGLTEMIPVIALWIMPEGGNVPLEILWGFGVACMTGGVPTMHPCSISYAYGRREYQSANRIIMAIQLIPSAFAAMMMVALIEAGKAGVAFGILFVVIIIGLIATAMMRSIPDMNAADRDYVQKKDEAEA
ncbi:MAG: MFS transporter [Oscillospiraceae bacterium]|nr:MFS transporter [Oscillospiraceae bacterium]